jgi:hypothetical protein
MRISKFIWNLFGRDAETYEIRFGALKGQERMI